MLTMASLAGFIINTASFNKKNIYPLSQDIC
uniref:PE66L n=1 Tax=African swine fever virus TaxID=10497 RepID=A0A6G7KTZ0_ASF